MITRALRWSWQNRDIALGLDEAGSGPLLLLLPALSSICTRAEMHPLMARLKSQFRVVALDWPGFGTASRAQLRWTPDALSAFLRHALAELGGRPHGIIAAGHGATYVLHHAAQHPGCTDRIALLAPTWRGPLPTMAGGDRPLFAKIRRLIELPGLGHLLYRLNVSSFVVRRMVSCHVYSDPAWVRGGPPTPERAALVREGGGLRVCLLPTGRIFAGSRSGGFFLPRGPGRRAD